MQIYEALVNDHRKLQGILDRLVALNEGDEEMRHELVGQVRDELIPHSRAEEAVFYNSIRAINTAKDMAWHGYEEHMMAETLLRTLQTADKIDVEWKAVANKLRDALNHHIKEEEEEMIPAAKQLFTAQEAEVMAEAFEEMKPEILDSGIMQTTLDMIANIMPARLAAPLRSFTHQV